MFSCFFVPFFKGAGWSVIVKEFITHVARSIKPLCAWGTIYDKSFGCRKELSISLRDGKHSNKGRHALISHALLKRIFVFRL